MTKLLINNVKDWVSISIDLFFQMFTISVNSKVANFDPNLDLELSRKLRQKSTDFRLNFFVNTYLILINF